MQIEMYRDYMARQLAALAAIDSPSGYTDRVEEYLVGEFRRLGFAPRRLNKGGVFVSLGGEDRHPMTMLSHVDTLCAVVRGIKSDGRLAISNVNLHINAVETENVRIITRFDGVYEGTIQLVNPSVHVNSDVTRRRDFETNMEVVLDELVFSAEDVKKLGIRPGDVIALDPRFRITEKGFIKSRFLDDKISVACLLGFARYISENGVKLPRRVDILITAFEEVGHGGSCGIPGDAVEILSVDMGCVGADLTCTEQMVSICAKDSCGIYNRRVTDNLIRAAEEDKIRYAVDIYPHYSSDASVALESGYDVRAGLIGPGVYASHGYERSHLDGLTETFRLLCAYTRRDRFEE